MLISDTLLLIADAVLSRRNEWAKRKLKKGMERNSTCIYCCHSCWCSNYCLFQGSFPDVFQKSGFSCACLTRQKHRPVGVIDKICCQLKKQIIRITFELIHQPKNI